MRSLATVQLWNKVPFTKHMPSSHRRHMYIIIVFIKKLCKQCIKLTEVWQQCNILKFGNCAATSGIATNSNCLRWVLTVLHNKHKWSLTVKFVNSVRSLATMLEIASPLEVCQQWELATKGAQQIVDKLLGKQTLALLFESLLLLMSFKLKEIPFSSTLPQKAAENICKLNRRKLNQDLRASSMERERKRKWKRKHESGREIGVEEFAYLSPRRRTPKNQHPTRSPPPLLPCNPKPNWHFWPWKWKYVRVVICSDSSSVALFLPRLRNMLAVQVCVWVCVCVDL